MSVPTAHWTPERLRRLPEDGNRYEVVDGELLVTPAPRWAHQRAVGRLFMLLASHLERTGVGEALMSPADIELSSTTLVQPDLFVVPASADSSPGKWSDIRTLLLAVEILSPGTARADRQVKRVAYQRFGVGEYWIVDLDARIVERWRPQDQRPEIVSVVLSWQPVLGGEVLTIDMEPFFRGVHGD